MDYLSQILERKNAEVRRRALRVDGLQGLLGQSLPDPERREWAVDALRRSGSLPAIIGEVKFRSPSAGAIRPRRPGDAERIAQSYVRGGAAAVSVLADGPGFGGSVLDVRRVARAVDVPVLFKEFVLDPVQARFARVCGASLVLLLVRALSDARLNELVAAVRAEGMEPVVEAADEPELERALQTDAIVVGVNARDLKSFRLDMETAGRCIASIPSDRVAVFMSGVRSREDLVRVADTRADAVLVGEGLMRSEDPERLLRRWLGAT